MNITDRLLAAANFIPAGKTFADIGTDHGYLPVYMCSRNALLHTIAADIGEGPLTAARQHAAAAGLTGRIDCRLGDGLTCLAPGEVDGAVICGMGGPLMVRILSASPQVWKRMEFLVLQPQTDAAALRRFLYGEGWHLDAETLVMDSGRLYEIMRAVPGREALLPPWQYEIGPVNWNQKTALLKEKIKQLIDKKEHILAGLKKSRHHTDITEAEADIQEWRDRLCQLQ